MLNVEASCSKNLYRVSKMKGTLYIINNVIWMLVYIVFFFIYFLFLDPCPFMNVFQRFRCLGIFFKEIAGFEVFEHVFGSLRCRNDLLGHSEIHTLILFFVQIF